ncbi:MAG: hypothetical protein EA350_01385 [Gemmatimonadales bacterium]|nr:MAG: hypothetical protein EA350_01385 [Gemmatimonadales bacterium]
MNPSAAVLTLPRPRLIPERIESGADFIEAACALGRPHLRSTLDRHASLDPEEQFAAVMQLVGDEWDRTRRAWAEEDGTLTPARFVFLTEEQVQAQEAPAQLLDGILTVGGLAALVGPSGEGKTFLVLKFARELAEQGRTVLYVASEGAYSLSPRLKALRSVHAPREAPLPLYVVPQPVNLMDAGEIAVFLEEVKQSLPEPPAWIVFDTLAQSMVGGDENLARDMGVVVQNCNRVRELTGSAVLLVHHTGHGMDRERGSTALRAGVDTMALLKKDEEGVLVLSCLKQKDMAPFDPMRYELVPVGLSCVIGPSSGIGPSLSEAAVAVLRSLDRSSMGDGLTSTDWEAAFGGPRSTFMLHRKRLYDLGYVVRDKPGRGARYSVSPFGSDALRGEGP